MLAVSVNVLRRCAKVSFSDKNLLYTNTGISVVMSFIGDGLQQKLQISKKEIPGWNRSRSRDVSFYGFIIGPACHYWYLMLDKWLPGRSFRTVAKKLVVDQCICSPMAIGSFLFITSFLEGKKSGEIRDEVLHKGITLYKAEWVIWPPAQTFQFFFLSTKYRVLFDNSVSFCFDWYYSYIKYGKWSENDRTDYENNQRDTCSESKIVDSDSTDSVNKKLTIPPRDLDKTV